MKARILAPENRKWWTLAALSFALFMIMLDNTVVNVALPSIQRDLGIGISELEWVVTAYALSFAVFLLTGGKLADRYGRRRVFLIGLTVFTLSSLACGLAGGAGLLIGARIVQGIGAALMMPATLSIISAVFPPRERGAAIGIWAGVSAMALAIGPLVGGVLAEKANWNWIFYINVPVGLLGIIAALVLVPESRDESAVQRLDLPGLVTAGIAVFALTYALIEGNSYGWGSARILGLFVLFAVALLSFILLERHQRAPMLDLSLFKSGTFAGANTVALMVSLAMFGVFFFISLYMQNILGYSAIKAGATFLPMTILIILVAPAAGILSDRLGSRWLMAGGMTLVAGSLVIFAQLGTTSGFWNIFPGLIIGGVGMALTMSPMTSAALSAVSVDKAGVASGVLNTFRQVGGSLGIAVGGAILASYVSVAPQSPQFADQFVTGLQHALYTSAGIALAAALVAAVTISKPRTSASAHEAVEAVAA
jgi:EmrB/QacA subfamily drug resistance transporter